MGINYIPDIVQKFKAEHDIHFNMVQSNISGIPILLKNGECDFGFGSFFEDKDMDYLELFQEKIDLLVPPNHRLASKKSVCFADFADEEIISFQKTAHIYKQVQEIYASRGKTPKIAGEVTNEVVMGNMVFRSNLVALVPRVENYNYYNAKLLPITDIDVHRSLYVYWCKNRPLSDTLKNFLSFIVKTKTTNFS
ncbi:MAG: hypothetical protein HUK23_08035, partial [Sphaerochaetaceae bacterium]|nr:hypothetical protein [Sphaerochaetaceae bacterium]